MDNMKRGSGLSMRARAAMIFASVLAAGAITSAPNAQRSQPASPAQPPASSIAEQAKGDRSQPLQQAPSTGSQTGSVAVIGGGLDTVHTQKLRGLSRKDWGMSQDCARMVRKSRLRAAGLGGQHI